MDNYKIIQVLRTFNKKELRRFGEFVKSPYFNKNSSVIALYDSLSKYHPNFKNKDLTIGNLHAAVFPSAEFDYHKINNVISDLYQLSEKFLAQAFIEQKDFYVERNLFRTFREKGLYKLYDQKHSEYMKKLIGRKHKDEQYFYYLYEMNDEYLWYATIRKPNTELNILQTEFDHFFRYALIRLLRFYNLMLHERNQNNVDFRLTMFNEIFEHIKENDFEDSPALMIFKTILLLLHSKDVMYFNKLKTLKEKYLDDFSDDDKHLVFIHLYDFAAYMVNFSGDNSYNIEMFNIYRELIDRKLMTPESFLYPNFMNVVKVACRVKEFEYAERFIEKFKVSIPKAELENVLEFCYGSISYSRGKLEVALKHFSRSNFQNFIFKVQVKIMLLKIYYYLKMYEQAEAMIDTFRHFVGREENLLSEHRDAYYQFLKLAGELIRVNESGGPDERDFRLKKIKSEAEKIPANPFRIKVWLLEELNG